MSNTYRPGVGACELLCKTIVFFSPILIIAALLYIKELDHKLYRMLVKEDGFVEYMTCINYLIASVVGLIMARAFWIEKSRFLFSMYLLFSLCCLFVAGEEISWGQRLFGIRPPEFFLENSFQLEMNVHNLKQIRDLDNYFAARILTLIGLYGSLSWIVFACLKSVGLGNLQRLCVPYLSPRWFLTGYFLPVAVYFYYIANLLPQHYYFGIHYRDQESMEFMLSLGFLLFVIFNRLNQSSILRSGVSSN